MNINDLMKPKPTGLVDLSAVETPAPIEPVDDGVLPTATKEEFISAPPVVIDEVNIITPLEQTRLALVEAQAGRQLHEIPLKDIYYEKLQEHQTAYRESKE